MNAELLFDVLYLFAVLFGFVLLLCLGEGIFNLLYRYIPAFRVWYDKLDEGLPNWDEE